MEKLNNPNCTFTTRDSIFSIKIITVLSCVLLTFMGANPIKPIHQIYDMLQGEEEEASPGVCKWYSWS
jgi:hypothetical protein